MILVSFEVKHRRRIFLGWEKGMKGKVKERFAFITFVMDKVYWLNGIWVELLKLNLPY